MTPEFDWDDDNVEHIARHGVSPEEAEQALADPDQVGQPASRGASGERRWSLLGETDAGRLLSVVFTRREGLTRVITARDADEGERRIYRRRRRR